MERGLFAARMTVRLCSLLPLMSSKRVLIKAFSSIVILRYQTSWLAPSVVTAAFFFLLLQNHYRLQV